jgi:solute carrier family 25 carnitine/acylcarnitine transporter 20/29
MSDFWAGYASGAAGIIIGNPLDLLKVRLQAGAPIFIGDPASFSSQFDGAGSLIKGTPTAL